MLSACSRTKDSPWPSRPQPRQSAERSASSFFSSLISRSRGSAPFFPLVKAASPPARNSSRQRYSVCSAIPKRRAKTAAASSRRNSAKTAQQCQDHLATLCCTQLGSFRHQIFLSDQDFHFQSIPKENSHTTIPKNLEQYSSTRPVIPYLANLFRPAACRVRKERDRDTVSSACCVGWTW